MDRNTGNYGPSFLIIERTNSSLFLSILLYLHCMTRDLNFEKNCCIVSILLGCSAINSFSKIWPLSSSCFANNNSSLSHNYFGLFSPSRWKSSSLNMWAHMNPNASSSLFRYFEFSRGCWGSTSLPVVTLYRSLLHNTICISSLQLI